MSDKTESGQDPFTQMVTLLKSMTPEQQQKIVDVLVPSKNPPKQKPITSRTVKRKEGLVTIETENRREDGQQRRMAKSSPIELGPKENRFLTMMDKRGNKIAESCKADSKIDKMLTKNMSLTPRMREHSIIEAECLMCGKKCEINSGTILERERFTCDECLKRGE